MMTKRSETTRWPWSWSWTSTNVKVKEVLPFVAMLTLTCLDMSVLTVVKAAMNEGTESMVYVVYHNALGTFILLPFFIIHSLRNRNLQHPPRPLGFHLLFRFFILGLLGVCLFQVLVYVGVNYSSPTLASAITNLIPGNTFLLALIFRMEKIDLQSSSSQAKLLATIIAISGATVFTFYQGPGILETAPTLNSNSPDLVTLSQPSNWVLGGLILVIAATVRSIWNVLQSATTREYSNQQTIVFFYCLFGTIQCIALSPLLVPDPSAWLLQPGLGMIAVVLGAVYSTAFHSNVVTWCLRKKGPVFVAMFSPLSIVIGVIMGITFLGDSLYLGSAIGAVMISAGFYSVMWGQAKEKNKLQEAIDKDFVVANEPGSSDQSVPLLSSRNDSRC